jgi:two-component sensor histidine kinase
LAGLTRQLISDPFDAAELASRMHAAVEGRPSLRMEIEARGATVLFRAMPLRPGGRSSGALVLVRDVTEVRRRDRALLSKDATIREIHHRVKNNLQTVAALLRLQARRMDNESARLALEEAVRRVGSIAIVHEILSQAVEERVDFDEIIDPLGRMVTEVSAVCSRVRVRRVGSFGVLPSESATALAMVLTELLQNAVEHGYDPADEASSGSIVVRVRRLVGRLHVSVDDDGRGLPADFDLDGSTNLGLSIVRTLVESELGGQLELGRSPGGRGTRAAVDVPLD